ncbi:MAG: DUF2202 domain-containing protein [Bacteroidales bacterium]|nr:DUF2202 domain-containing protein [Bacteroidales bacterium]
MKFKMFIVLGSFMTSLLFGMNSCTKDNNGQADLMTDSIIEVAADGTTIMVQSSLGSCLTDDLSFTDGELDILMHMKEEEKLARDVYAALYEKWGTPIFSNISSAEETHMNAVLLLLQSYGDEYKLAGDPGVFTNPDFQELYGELVEQGSESIEAAFKTGALIEDMDIKDLEEYLGVASNENILLVFENLLRGSRNHLRAFTRQLERIGATYTPVYITQEEYDEITSSPNETGRGSRAQGQGNGRFGNRNRNGW